MNKVNKAINHITNAHPWIGRVLNRLPKTYSDMLPNGEPCTTMATNGKALFINPAFVDSLTHSQLKGVCVHEAIHVIQRHPLRRGNRDPELYGIAIDAATNWLTIRLGYVLPKDRITEVRDRTVEQIYDSLAAARPPQPQPQPNPESNSDSSQSDSEQDSQDTGTDANGTEGQESDESSNNSQESDESGNGESESGSGESSQDSDGAQPGSSMPSMPEAGSDVLDYPLEPGQTMQDAEREMDRLIAEAQLDMTLAEEAPTTNEAEVFTSKETELNWPAELEEYIHVVGGADYSMNPPHIGLAQQGIICNQLNPTGCGNVVLAIDTSGSINRSKLDLAITHLMLFVENMDYESLRVIACSSRIVFDRTFYRGETVDVSEMHTGGGTRFKPVFNRLEEDTAPDLLIYFTDMETFDMTGSDDPGFPIVWLVDNECGWTRDGRLESHIGFQPDYGKLINACQ